jgi:hypothetical protein
MPREYVSGFPHATKAANSHSFANAAHPIQGISPFYGGCRNYLFLLFIFIHCCLVTAQDSPRNSIGLAQGLGWYLL